MDTSGGDGRKKTPENKPMTTKDQKHTVWIEAKGSRESRIGTPRETVQRTFSRRFSRRMRGKKEETKHQRGGKEYTNYGPRSHVRLS